MVNLREDRRETPDGSAEQRGEGIPKASRRRRRWLRRLALVVLLLIGLVAASPYLASTGVVRRWVVSLVNQQVVGRVGVERIRLSWRGPCEVGGLHVDDPEGRRVLAVDRVIWSAGVWGAITALQELGEILVERPQTLLHVDAQGQISLIRALSLRTPSPGTTPLSLPELTGRLVLERGSLRVTRADGREYTLPELNLQCDLSGLSDLRATLVAKLAGEQTLDVRADVQGLAVKGILRPADATGKIRVVTSGDIDVESPARLFTAAVGVAGKAGASLEATFAASEIVCDGLVTVSGLKVSREGRAAVNPVDVSVGSRVRIAPEGVVAEAALGGSAAKGDVRLEYTPLTRPAAETAAALATAWLADVSHAIRGVSGEAITAAVLAGKPISLPHATVAVNTEMDLAAVARAAPGLLAIRPGVQVDAGRLKIKGLTIRGGEQPYVKGAMSVTDLAAVDGGRPVRWEPTSLHIDAAMEAGQGFRMRRAEFDSEFGKVVAKGTAQQIRVDLKADLAKLHRQVSQLIDIGPFAFGGEISAGLDLARAGDDRANVTCDIAATGFHLRAKGRDVDLQNVAIKGNGHVRLAGSEVARFTAEAVSVDLDGKAAVAGSGWFEPKQGAFHGEVDVKEADLGYVGAKAAAWGAKDLARGTGTVRITAKADRESSQAAIVSDGRLVMQKAAVDGVPLTEGDITCIWSETRYGPATGALRVKTADLQAGIASASVTNGQVQFLSDLAVDGKIEATADVAKCLATVARILKWKETPRVAGRMSLETRCASDKGILGVTGTCRVEDLAIGAGTKTVREKQLSLTYDASLNRGTATAALKKLELASGLLSLRAAGTADEYTNTCVLALKGDYEGSWEAITALIHEFAPGTRETISFAGSTASPFTVTGPVRQATVQPVFSGLTSGLEIGWGSAETYGISVGKAVLAPSLRGGKITIPVAAMPASGGQVRLGGTIDLQPAVPEFALPGATTIADGVPVTPKMGHYILSRINPLFAGLIRMEGKVSLTVEDVSVPLGEEIKRRGRGRGRLDLKDFRVQPGGLLGMLLELGGPGLGDMLAVQFSGVDFVLEDGRVRYKDFVMTFPDGFDLKFWGSIGFDETMELWVSVPVRPALLEKLGFRGPMSDYAKALEGTRVPIPIAGTRLQPKLDLSRIDRKALEAVIEKVSKEAIKEGAGRLLENLNKPKPKKSGK